MKFQKKSRQPDSGDGLVCPVVLPSSEPMYSGKDANIDNQYDSYDDGQKCILKGMNPELQAW
jgi:hypothetical protein